MMWSLEWEEEDGDSDPEIVTMREVARMASSIMNNIKFTYDTPVMNEKKTMAVLDTQVWMGEEQREEGIPRGMLKEGEHPEIKIGKLRKVILFSFLPKANDKQDYQPKRKCTTRGDESGNCQF